MVFNLLFSLPISFSFPYTLPIKEQDLSKGMGIKVKKNNIKYGGAEQPWVECPR
jgi:hypothetical protein